MFRDSITLTNRSGEFEESVLPWSGRSTDTVSLVMGPLKSGKSTFVNRALERCQQTGCMEVNSRLSATTLTIQSVALDMHTPPSPYGRFILVDTPGLHGDPVEDRKLLAAVSNWIQERYCRAQGPLSCNVIYLHDISQDAFSATASRFMELVRLMVPVTRTGKIIIATSKWDKCTPDEGARREEELKAEYWPDPIATPYESCSLSNKASISTLLGRLLPLTGHVSRN